MIKILSESGHERNRNAGDEAYFAAMVDLFRQHCSQVQITAFSDRPEHDRQRYGVQSVYCGGSLVKTIFSLPSIFRAIADCDVYVWGAGQILRDDTHILAPAYRLWRPLLAKLLGKPVMAYAVGIGPLDTPRAKALTRFVLNRFDLVSYRDGATGDILAAAGITGKELVRTVDPAFGLRPASEAAVDVMLTRLGLAAGRRPLMGVAAYGPAYRGKFRGIRSILPASFQATRNIWDPQAKRAYDRHVDLLAKAYDHMIEAHGLTLVFIIQDASGQGLDERITNDILARMRSAGCAHCLMADDYPPALIKGLMGRMEMVTGGRMHSLILAAGQHTPIHATCYENKIKAFGEVIGLRGHFIDAYSLQKSDELIESMERAWSARSQIRHQLSERIAELQSEVELNVRRLNDLVNQQPTYRLKAPKAGK